MKIAVIGSGHVGQALGNQWLAKQHQVTYGMRNLQTGHAIELKQKIASLGGQVAPILDAVRQAEVIFLAVPWSVAIDVVKGFGDIKDKVLIDATKAVKFGGPIVERSLDGPESCAERIQASAPDLYVVKAFNQYGFEILNNPSVFKQTPVLFVAGFNQEAKKIVMQLTSDVGFNPIDAGILLAARLIEDMGRLWMSLIQNPKLGRNFSFTLQK